MPYRASMQVALLKEGRSTLKQCCSLANCIQQNFNGFVRCFIDVSAGVGQQPTCWSGGMLFQCTLEEGAYQSDHSSVIMSCATICSPSSPT